MQRRKESRSCRLMYVPVGPWTKPQAFPSPIKSQGRADDESSMQDFGGSLWNVWL